MSQPILLKRSATPGKIPLSSDLSLGELAVNTNDGTLFTRANSTVVQIGAVTSVAGRTGAVTLSTSDVSEGSNLYFTSARASAAAPVQSVFGRTGAVTATSSDITTALGFTPYNATNPNNYVTATGSTNLYQGGDLTLSTQHQSTNNDSYLSLVNGSTTANNITMTPVSATSANVGIVINARAAASIKLGTSNGSNNTILEINGATTATNYTRIIAGGGTGLGPTISVVQNDGSSGNLPLNIIPYGNDYVIVQGTGGVQATNFIGALQGNASTATKLFTARTINGVSFDGSANISFTTSAVTEGSNLYYTDTRARASISVSGSGLSYNSSTGAISISNPSTSWSSLTAPTANNSVTATVDTSQTLLGHFDTSAGTAVSLMSFNEDVASTKSGVPNNRPRILSVGTLAGSTAHPFVVSALGATGLGTFAVNYLGQIIAQGATYQFTTSGATASVASGAGSFGTGSGLGGGTGNFNITTGDDASAGTTGSIMIKTGTSTGGTTGTLTLGAGANANVITISSTPGITITGPIVMSGAVNNAQTITLASAATVNIGAAAANDISISGTTTITAFDTVAAGAVRHVTFQGILTLTYNATSMILPSAANITTAAGDSAQFTSLGSGNWRCDYYQKANGQSIIGAPDATKLPLAGGTMSGALNLAPTATLASAATVNIGAAAANDISITGTTTITAFDTIAAGAERTLHFTGILTLTYNSTTLILPGAASITTAAGDTAVFVSLGSGNWKCNYYTKANGQSVVSSSSSAAGSSGQVQYNSSGSFAGAPGLVYSTNGSTTHTISLGSATSTTTTIQPTTTSGTSPNQLTINAGASTGGNGGVLTLNGGSATGTSVAGDLSLLPGSGADAAHSGNLNLYSPFFGPVIVIEPTAGATKVKKVFDLANTVSVASAATTAVGSAVANDITITGTTTITAFDGAVNGGTGSVRTVHFAGSLTLTHNSSTFILPGAANIVTAAGDSAEFVSITGGWRCNWYTKANGQSVIATAAAGTTGNIQYNNGSNVFTASAALSFTAGSNNILTLGDTTVGHNIAITIPQPGSAGSGNAFNINGSNANGANSGGSINISAGSTASGAGNGGTLILAGGVNSNTSTQNGSVQLNTGANTNILLKADISSNFGGAINEAPTITLPSAATVNIGAAAANDIIISGTTTITAFDAINQAGGVRRTVRFSGALTLTHNGSSLILPGAASITTANGDVAEFVSIGVANSGQWKCVYYTRANGQPVPTVAIANGGTGATTAAAAVVALGIPYDIAGAIYGKPAASATVLRFIAVRAFTIPSGATSSLAKSSTAATASTTLTMNKNGASFGTIVWSASGTTGAFTVASSTSFAAGDLLTITAPASQDTTFADAEFTLVCTLN